MIAQPFTTSLSLPAFRARAASPSNFQCLRDMDIFSNCPDGDLLSLAALAHERRVRKGEILIRQDEPEGKHLFILLEGEATTTWEDAGGFESLLATLGPGDMAGEMELFGAELHGATVRATMPSRLLAIHRDDLMRGLREKPGLALGFLCGIARRLRQSNRRIAGICHQKTPRRVASILVSMMDEHGIRMKDSEGRRCVLLTQRPTQRRIAGLAGTARETVSRLFKQWEDTGLFSDRNGDLMICNEAGLRRMAGEE